VVFWAVALCCLDGPATFIFWVEVNAKVGDSEVIRVEVDPEDGDNMGLRNAGTNHRTTRCNNQEHHKSYKVFDYVCYFFSVP